METSNVIALVSALIALGALFFAWRSSKSADASAESSIRAANATEASVQIAVTEQLNRADKVRLYPSGNRVLVHNMGDFPISDIVGWVGWSAEEPIETLKQPVLEPGEKCAFPAMPINEGVTMDITYSTALDPDVRVRKTRTA